MKKHYKFAMYCFMFTYIPLVVVIFLTKPLYMQSEMLQSLILISLFVFYVFGGIGFLIASIREDMSDKYWELKDELQDKMQSYEAVRTKLVVYIIKNFDKDFK